MRFEFPVNFKKVRHIAVKEKETAKEPRLRQSLVLAYQLEELFATGRAKNLKELSNWLHMSHARISQIMSLLFLAPDIQEKILLSDGKRISQLTERRVRKIALEVDWEKQQRRWRELTGVAKS